MASVKSNFHESLESISERSCPYLRLIEAGKSGEKICNIQPAKLLISVALVSQRVSYFLFNPMFRKMGLLIWVLYSAAFVQAEINHVDCTGFPECTVGPTAGPVATTLMYSKAEPSLENSEHTSQSESTKDILVSETSTGARSATHEVTGQTSKSKIAKGSASSGTGNPVSVSASREVTEQTSQSEITKGSTSSDNDPESTITTSEVTEQSSELAAVQHETSRPRAEKDGTSRFPNKADPGGFRLDFTDGKSWSVTITEFRGFTAERTDDTSERVTFEVTKRTADPHAYSSAASTGISTNHAKTDLYVMVGVGLLGSFLLVLACFACFMMRKIQALQPQVSQPVAMSQLMNAELEGNQLEGDDTSTDPEAAPLIQASATVHQDPDI